MSVVAAAVVTSAVLSYDAAGNAVDAQNRATDAAMTAADRQARLAEDQFKWNKETYERDVAPAQREAQRIQSELANESLAASKQQRQFSDEQRQYYKDTFQPIEKKVADEAMNYDSQENVDRRSGIAAANVNQQFSNARGQSARLAGRYGLGSTAFSGPAGASERAQALGTAGAATGAAFDTMDKGIGLRAGAANFGRNMPNTAATFGTIGNQSASVGSGAATAGLNSGITGANFMNGATGNYINQIGQSAGLQVGALQNQANSFNAQAAGFGMFAGGLLGNKTAQTALSNGWDKMSNWFSGSSTPVVDAGVTAMPTMA
jgi:hypothetical protein